MKWSDYAAKNGIEQCIRDENGCIVVWCLSKNVADWCKKQGLFVTPPISSAESSCSCVNYSISIIEQDK